MDDTNTRTALSTALAELVKTARELQKIGDRLVALDGHLRGLIEQCDRLPDRDDVEALLSHLEQPAGFRRPASLP